MNTLELSNALKHGWLAKLGDLPDHFEGLVRNFEEDLEWLRIEDFDLKSPEMGIPYFHYAMGETRNSINNADPSHSKDELFQVKNFNAPGLAFGELFWLFLNCYEGRRVIRNLWLNDEELRKDLALKKRRKHFNTLNEIFWLGRWNGITTGDVQKDVCISSEVSGTVDWQANLKYVTANAPDLHFNIEVKNLMKSLRYLVGANQDSGQFVKDGIQGVDSKFPAESGNDLNVLCITVYMFNREMVRGLAEEIFELYSGVDGIVVWQAHGRPCENFCRMWRNTNADEQMKGRLLETIFRPPGPEHVWPLPAAVPLWGVLPGQQDEAQ